MTGAALDDVQGLGLVSGASAASSAVSAVSGARG